MHGTLADRTGTISWWLKDINLFIFGLYQDRFLTFGADVLPFFLKQLRLRNSDHICFQLNELSDLIVAGERGLVPRIAWRQLDESHMTIDFNLVAVIQEGIIFSSDCFLELSDQEMYW